MKKMLLAGALAILMCFTSVQIVDAKTTAKETWISKTAQAACVEYGNEYGICPELLMAIIERESSGKANVSNGSCIGLMQISSRWHSDRMEKLGVTTLYSERGNVHVGADYLAELFEDYGEAALALMIYHGESNAITKYECGEISSYASGILERSAQLERLHKK